MSSYLNALATWETYRARWNDGCNPDIPPAECIAVATRDAGGYIFFLVGRTDKRQTKWTYTIYAGCRHNFTIAQYRKHVREYPSKRRFAHKRHQTTAILDLFAAIVRRRK
jgi:hypothetical protein